MKRDRSRSAARGTTVSSSPSRWNVAGAEFTSTESTVSPTRSRLNDDRACVARAWIVAVPCSTSVAGS